MSNENQNVVVCKYCQRKMQKGALHQCEQMRGQSHSKRKADEDDGDFFVSFGIASTTNDWALGFLGGGNLAGAILGVVLAGDVEYDEDEVADGDLPPIDELDELPSEEESIQEEDEDSVGGDVDDTLGDTSDTY